MPLVYSPLMRAHSQKLEKKAEQKMPLIHGKSKKAFSKNVEAEMDAGKPQKQSLAIAYSIKRQAAKRKMAKGGMVRPDADNARDEREMDMLDKHPLEMSQELDARKEKRPSIDSGDQDSSEDMRMLTKSPGRSPELDARKSKMVDIDSGDQDDSIDLDMTEGRRGDIEPDLHDELHMPSADHDDDMIDRIMLKRKHMYKGGMVDGDEPDQHDMKEDMPDDDGMVDPAANNAEQKNHLDDMSFDALHDPFTDSDMMEATQPEDSNLHGHEIDSDEHDMVSAIRRKMMSRRRS